MNPSNEYQNGDRLAVVAVTAFVNEDNIKQCYQIGMKEVLHKPVNCDALGKVLNQYYHYKKKK